MPALAHSSPPFARIYEELRIVPPVELLPLKQIVTIRSARAGWSVSVGRGPRGAAPGPAALAPTDGVEIDRLVAAAAEVADISPGVDQAAPELASLRDQLRSLWDLRDKIGTLVHFRGSVGEWAHHRIRARCCGMCTNLMPAEAPMLFVLMILGYLARDWLSRPLGGTARFRDALVNRYHALGGEARLDTTVEEIVVKDDAAQGVRLTDGTLLSGDLVVSTSSTPETVMRLLGGRYGADALRHRLDTGSSGAAARARELGGAPDAG